MQNGVCFQARNLPTHAGVDARAEGNMTVLSRLTGVKRTTLIRWVEELDLREQLDR